VDGSIDHLFGNPKIAIVVDPYFGNYINRLSIPDQFLA
jgi:hypothetical protein